MKKNLRAHIAIHERKEYPCPVPGCGEIFQSAFLMKAHNNLKHAGVKFECTSCKMEFKAKSSLARHIQFLHEGKVKSKFRCSLCDMQFAHKETLRKHTETVCKHLFSTYLMLISFRDFSQSEKLSEIKPSLASVRLWNFFQLVKLVYISCK